ncbi:hypothetical protein Hamer_G009482 [Homarus americanus]|uniref:Uncharacterized protein n=1 Tax=Homarus americanus TaxID=6706 RepID=A0A8J5JAF7_HOMAM|nr:hypothetical protein Hamer_G009482 [Homarus americanus]
MLCAETIMAGAICDGLLPLLLQACLLENLVYTIRNVFVGKFLGYNDVMGILMLVMHHLWTQFAQMEVTGFWQGELGPLHSGSKTESPNLMEPELALPHW